MRHPSGPSTRRAGVTSTNVEAIHQPDAGSPFTLARMPRTPVTIPTMREMNTTISAIKPRLAQPTSETGVRYSTTIAIGAMAGRRMIGECTHNRRLIFSARYNPQTPTGVAPAFRLVWGLEIAPGCPMNDVCFIRDQIENIKNRQ